MKKYFLVGVTAFALTTGAALAQTTSETVTTTTIPAAPTVVMPSPAAPGTYSTTKSQQTIDSTGTKVEKSQSYTTGVNGTAAATTVQTVAPDGTQRSTSHEEQTVSPRGETTTSRSVTTTTER